VRSGKYLEAQPLLEQALACEQSLSERQDFFYATILNNIAELQLGLGHTDEAYRLCQEACRQARSTPTRRAARRTCLMGLQES